MALWWKGDQALRRLWVTYLDDGWWSTASCSLFVPNCHPPATSVLPASQGVPGANPPTSCWRHTWKCHSVSRNGWGFQELHGFLLCHLACQGAPPSQQGGASVSTTPTTHSLAPLVPRRCSLMLQRWRWTPKFLEIQRALAFYKSGLSLETPRLFWQIIQLPFRKAVKGNTAGCVFAHIC